MAEAELYKKALFDPDKQVRSSVRAAAPTKSLAGMGAGDEREHLQYVYSDEIVLAVNVALAAKRPLLVSGASGTGKSALARSVASKLGWRYGETTVTSRTQARDLLYEVDLLRRLHDAQVRDEGFTESFRPYIIPGPLWWAFDEASARRQLGVCKTKRGASVNGPEGKPAVVLVDEIDKADPDTPNNLLVPLGSFMFEVEELGEKVQLTSKENAPLLVITTNEERELPPAFLRRCVHLRLELPARERMDLIGKAVVPDVGEAVRKDVLGAVYEGNAGVARVSPAEFVDALRACRDLRINTANAAFQELLGSTIWKGASKGMKR